MQGTKALIFALPKLTGVRGELAVTTDTLVESVHFFPDPVPDRLGHKSAAVNLSDLAAMGATPRQVFAQVEGPNLGRGWCKAFEDGFSALVHSSGGESRLEFSQGSIIRISVIAMGEVPRANALTRDGARIGHRLAVTGSVGDAQGALQLAYAQQIDESSCAHQSLMERLDKPTPRVEAGLNLRGIASAALDLSDGLLGDVTHLLHEKAPGVLIYPDRLPVSAALAETFGDDEAVRCALRGGDDYELCFTFEPDRELEVRRVMKEAETPYSVIGEVVAKRGVELDTSRRSLQAVSTSNSYEHQFE